MLGPELQRAEEPAAYDFNLQTNGDPALVSEDGIRIGGWIEQIDNIATGGSESSPRYAHSTLYAYIPNGVYTPDGQDVLYRFENAVLGWHVTADDFQHIRRTNPIQHPRKRNLWAYKISECRGVQFQGRDTLTNAIVDVSPKSFAKYGRTLVAVEFAPSKVDMPDVEKIKRFREEDNVPEYLEQFRYTEYDLKTNIYDVSVQTGQFTYQEGAASNPKGLNMQGELNYLEVKTSFILRWKSVPQDFVLDTVNYGMGYPWKLVNAGGKVNSKWFMGYPPGTLLCLETEIDRYVSGTLKAKQAPIVPGQVSFDRNFWMCDVGLTLIHFDPPRFSEGNRGHNLKPWRKDTTTTPSLVTPWQVWRKGWAPAWAGGPDPNPEPEPSMLYYLVKYTTAAGVATATKIYGEYDFNKIFQHWSLA